MNYKLFLSELPIPQSRRRIPRSIGVSQVPYEELATNPLMLSMLLCVFGDKETKGKRTYAVQELYEKALDIMLTRVL